MTPDREQIRRDAKKEIDFRRGNPLAEPCLALLAELEQAERERDEALVAFYRADSVACANLCDGVLDKRGALLGRIRELAA